MTDAAGAYPSRDASARLFLAIRFAPDVRARLAADQAQALMGAKVFVIARLVYLPLYMLAVPVARSAVWTAGFAGLIVMGLALA